MHFELCNCLNLAVLLYGARGGIAKVHVCWHLQEDVQLLQRVADWTLDASDREVEPDGQVCVRKDYELRGP